MAKQRTLSQNRAMHLMMTHMANDLNDAGFDVKKTLPDVEVPWTMIMVKDNIIREIMMRLYGKTSTKDLTTKEFDVVISTALRFFHQNLGLETQYPSIETLMEEKRMKAYDQSI